MFSENQNVDSDGQIQGRATFNKVGGSEINSDLVLRKREIRIHDGTANSFSRFKNSFISHAHEIKTRETFVGGALNFNKLPRVAGRYGGKYFNIHNSMMNLLFKNAKKMMILVTRKINFE